MIIIKLNLTKFYAKNNDIIITCVNTNACPKFAILHHSKIQTQISLIRALAHLKDFKIEAEIIKIN